VWERQRKIGATEGTALQAAKKSRGCHPEPASFAGEGSAVRNKAKEKADSSPHQKPNGVRNDTFSLFPQPV
jgi:hypothetical protein